MTKAFMIFVFAILSLIPLQAQEQTQNSFAVEMGGTQYETLVDAVNAASTGITNVIKLLSDLHLESQVSFGSSKTIMVDGNGFVLSSDKTGTGVAYRDSAIILLKNNFKLKFRNLIVKDVDISIQPDAANETAALEIISGSYTNLRIKAAQCKGSFTINGGDFYEGAFSVRNYEPDEDANTGGSFVVNGGNFNKSRFEVYPEKRESSAWINSGVFRGCNIVCRDATSSLTIGADNGDGILPPPVFESCTNTVRGSFKTTPWTDKTIYKIVNGSFDSCQFTITNMYGNTDRKIALEVFDGAFTNCNFYQRKQSTYLNITNGNFVSSTFYFWSIKDEISQKGTHLNVSDGKFSACSFRAETTGSGAFDINLNFRGGEYRDCYVYQRIGYQEPDGIINVEGGKYYNTTFALRSATDSGYVKNGEFYGCKFVAHGYECYSSHYQRLYIEDGDYFGCVFAADNTAINPHTGNPSSFVYLRGGNFYGCSTYIKKVQFNKKGEANVEFQNGVVFKNAVRSGDQEYATLDAALSAAERPRSIELLYSAAAIGEDSVYDKSPTNKCYQISSGEKLVIKASDKYISADFSVQGELDLYGGDYFSDFEILPGGKVYATKNAIFRQEPTGVLYPSRYEMEFDGANGWWYLNLIGPTFQIILR